MSSDIKVRLYESGDEVGIVKLLDTVFNGWPHFDLNCSALDHWKWKFIKNSIPRVVVAEYNDEIIGANHSVPTKIKVGDRILRCNQATDLAIHPDYRKMKIYERMTKVKQRHHLEIKDNLTYSVSSSPRVIEIAKKLERPIFPSQVKVLARINNISLHTSMKNSRNPLLKKIGFKLLETTQKVSQFGKKIEPNKDLVSNNITIFDDRYKIFWDKIKDHYSFIVEKTPEHLNWRYFDYRSGNYIVKQLENDSGILGFVVLRVNMYNPEYPEGYIVDIVSLPERLDVVKSLLFDSIKYFDDIGVNSTYTWCLDGHPYLQVIKSFGFIDSMNDPSVLFNNYNVGSEWVRFLSAPSNRLFFQLGDTDWI